MGVLSLVALVMADAAGSAGHDLNDWAVEAGFGLEIDSSGFDLPTGIAFVPDPGPGAQDPLYFVTELGGDIKVVTNDRSVHTFASVPTRELPRRDLQQEGQTGLAGLCLHPAEGIVFVTHTYADDQGILRNGMTRFDTGMPSSFGLSPSEERTFIHVFAHAQSAPAHQIGHCAVEGERVFVGIGDGGNFAAARDLDVLLGKVVCLTVDGGPCPDNPFLEPRADPGPRDFVWAYGFRNPFGLTMSNGLLFAAENGVRTDRLLRVVRGEDHFWDGSTASISAGADVLLPTGPSPVQLDSVARDQPGLPGAGTFVFAVFHHSPFTGVMAFEYDFEHMRSRSAPRYLLQYIGASDQRVTAAAVGPDGIYTASALPDADGESHVLRLSYDPEAEHPYLIGAVAEDGDTAVSLLTAHSCISCHSINGEGGGIAPSLDRFGLRWRLTQRLNAPGYEEQVRAVDQLEEEPFVSFRNARQEVLAAEGLERTRVWLELFLTEPRFDNPDAQMPKLDLSSSEISELTEALYREMEDRDPGFLQTLISYARANQREIGAGYLLGFVTAVGLVMLWRVGRLLRHRQRSRRG